MKENKIFEEELKEAIIENTALEDLATQLYNSESNYNNADKTTHQTVYTKEEILSILETNLDIIKEDGEHCSGCGMPYDEEHFITETQKHPYGNTHAEENIPVGYKCASCGEEETF